MGWLWALDSIKLQVSFAEYRLFYRALLRTAYVLCTLESPYVVAMGTRFD